PPTTQAALVMQHAPCEAESKNEIRRDALWPHYERSPQSKKDRAAARLKILDAVEKMVANGTGRTQAIEIVAELNDKHPATLHEWFSLVRGHHSSDWLAALTPRYAGRTKKAKVSEEAWDYFKADYLRLEAPAATACYERLMRIAQ